MARGSNDRGRSDGAEARDEALRDPSSRRDPEVAQRIRASGLELFDRGGFDRTSVQEVAEHAGVAPITVYRTFATKSGIVFWMRDREAARLQVLAAQCTPDADPRTSVAKCLRQYAAQMPLDLAEYDRFVRIVRSSPHLRGLALASRMTFELALLRGLSSAGMPLDVAGRTACAGGSGALDVATRQWHKRADRRRAWGLDVQEALTALWPELTP